MSNWQQGDFLVDVVAELGSIIPRHEIHKQLAAAVGADRSTMRDRELMSRFWPDREQYAPLTYSQLRACKSAGDRAREYAEWALANLPAPVALIRAHIKHNGDLQPAWIARWDRVRELCELIAGDKEAPPVIRHAARVVQNIQL